MPVSIIWYSSTARSGAGQVPDRHAGLVGPDRDVAGACSVEQAAGPVGFAAGVRAALAVQDDQQRPVPLPGVVGVQGGGEPAGPQPDHQVRLARPGRADDDHVPGACGRGEGEDRLAGAATARMVPPIGMVPSWSAAGPGRARRCGLWRRGPAVLPLAGVEGDRGGGHPPADPGAERRSSARPTARRPGAARPGPRPGRPARTSGPRSGRAGASRAPSRDRGQRGGPPGVLADHVGDRVDGGQDQRTRRRRGAAGTAASPGHQAAR